MDNEMMKMLASQLRQPAGDFGRELGRRMNEGNLHINRNTIEALNLNAEATVLEIGMGNGYFVKDILEQYPSVRYKGCDFSALMVNEAEELNRHYVSGGKAAFVLAEAHRLPYNDAVFDCVFTVNTVYFWDQPAQVLAEIRRVLKPGGRVFISLRPLSLMQHYPFVQYGFQLYSGQTLHSLLSDHGFEAIASVEKEEPDQELDGRMLPFATLIVSGQRAEHH